MRDSLIELLKQKSCVYVPCDNECGGCKNVEMYDDSIESIADHLLSEGVIVPPVKVGDKLYVLSASKTKVYLLTITHFVVCKNEIQIWAVGAPYTSESAYICNADDLGNNEWVYLTREEAEKAIERSENGKS